MARGSLASHRNGRRREWIQYEFVGGNRVRILNRFDVNDDEDPIPYESAQKFEWVDPVTQVRQAIMEDYFCKTLTEVYNHEKRKEIVARLCGVRVGERAYREVRIGHDYYTIVK